jgi:hypothetical protein
MCVSDFGGKRLKGKCPYHLSFGGDKILSVCQNTFRALFHCTGENQWSTLMKEVKESGASSLKPHGNTGNKARAVNSPLGKSKPSLVNYLTDIKEKHGELPATHFVREESGTTTRDDDVDTVELPSHYSKRTIYERFCYSRGWIAKCTKKGNYGKVADYAKRPYDDVLFPEGSEYLDVPAWSSFCDVWAEEFPKMKIRSPSEDICGECYMYRNAFRFAKRGEDDDDDDDNATAAEANDVPNCLSNEELITKAKHHVEQAKAMREICTARLEQAKADKANGLPYSDAQQSFVGDYSQNLDIPHVGAEQPGDTYYFSPKNVYVFGCVDGSSDPAELDAYAYEEETGNKGSNNVASLLWKYLHDRKIVRYNDDGTPQKGKRLTGIFDNCTGQNKNNNVLRLAPFLVDAGYFEEVEFLFYVRGHTKNVCDRTYNLMKIRFNNRQVWTFRQLCSVLAEQPDVTVHPCVPADFLDFEKMHEQFYTKYKNNTIIPNHIFRAKSSSPRGTVATQTDTSTAEVLQSIRLTGGSETDAERATRMLDVIKNQMVQLEPPGLKEIKIVELATKWRKFVPAELQDEICPVPSQELLNRIKEQRKKKSQARAQAKQQAAAARAPTNT